MSSAFRNSQPKDSQNQRRSRPPGIIRAGRPNTSTYMGAISLQEECDMLTMILSEAHILDSICGPGRHEDQAKDPQTSAQIVKCGSYPTLWHYGALICNVGETEAQWAPEAGRPISPGRASLHVCNTQFIKGHKPSNHIRARIKSHVYTTE